MILDTRRRPGGLEKFQATDREECGLIIQNEDLLFVVRVPNRADSPDDYSIIKADYDVVAANLTPDESIVGFFHTHLPHHECEPSDSDFDGAEKNPDMLHLVYKPSTREVCWYGNSQEVIA